MPRTVVAARAARAARVAKAAIVAGGAASVVALGVFAALWASAVGAASPRRASPIQAQSPARDNPASTGGTASIRGRVVDAATGRALSRVEMRAGPNQVVLTDGEGRYEIGGLPAGTYTIVASKINYVRTSWGEQRAEGPGKRIALEDGQKFDNINIALRRGGVITGKVTDEFGDPATDVFVTAMRYQYVQGSRRLMPSGRPGQTNDIGEFRLYGLSPGQYYVSATLRNFSLFNTDTADRFGYAPTLYPGTGSVGDAQRLAVAAGQTIGHAARSYSCTSSPNRSQRFTAAPDHALGTVARPHQRTVSLSLTVVCSPSARLNLVAPVTNAVNTSGSRQSLRPLPIGIARTATRYSAGGSPSTLKSPVRSGVIAAE
jgi:hypothetical protein